MSLPPGTRLGPYEVLAPIGSGGMGEVYRARDPRLHRDVAIKVLPRLFADDPERLARFEREAQVLAAVNHPHIAHVYGLEAAPGGPGVGARALVMELVEGQTLSEKLGMAVTRALPIEEAVEIARQIADALDAAHQRGIVHRDLKPGNVKVRDDGTVKVLDFGLANWASRADPPGASSLDRLNSPTITSPALTARGTILGTAAYMSPEQAKGRPVDKRADIWAFGCVLFEMLAGRRPFEGDSITETLAAVMKDAPAWTALPEVTPTPIRRVLARCLEKDPRRRLHDIADARFEIEEAIALSGRDETGEDRAVHRPSAPDRMRRREMMAWATAALAVIAGVAGAVSLIGRRAETPAPLLSRVSLVHRGTVITGPPQISPDGRRVVYVARNPGGKWSLWVRELDAAEPRQLPGTEEFEEFSHHPFWSPDSRSLGFFGSRGLQRIAASGGGPQKLADIGFPRGGAWSSSGVILFAPEDNVGLVSVPEGGGPPTTITTLPKEGIWEHSWPSFLPDSRRFLFTALPLNRPFETSDAGIYLGSLDSPDIQRLLPDISSAIYSTLGYILFLREGVLTAAPFDAASGRVTGDVISLGERVTTSSSSHRATMSVSSNNILALRNAGSLEDLGQLQWVDRHGAATNVGVVRSYFFGASAVSPDGRHIAATISDVKTGSADIWLLDDAGNARRLTTSREWEGWPIWSADGKRIAYSSTFGARGSLLVQDVGGGEPVVVLEWREGVLLPRSWSADGRHLLVNRVAIPGRAPDIFVWSFESQTLTPFLDSPAAEFLGVFSPDGRFVAYVSDEAGPVESWVASFPRPTVKRRIATLAGPISWRADGREILVLGSEHDVSAIPVTISADSVAVGTPTVLAQGFAGGSLASASRDHSRLLRLVRPDPEQGVAEIRLLTGWLEHLHQQRVRDGS